MRISLAVALSVVLSGGVAARAVTVDFEGGGYTLAADGAATSTLSTAQSNSPTHSAEFYLPNTQADFAKVIIGQTPGQLQLGTVTGTFQTYLPTSNNPAAVGAAPYMYFGVDTNKNGTFEYTGDNTGDSFVIAFYNPGAVLGTWYEAGLNQATNVHVVGNRTGLTAGTYSSSGTQDTLGSLSALTLGSGTWGGLDILQVRVGAGETGGDVGPLTAYVDDIHAGAVVTPLPSSASMGLLVVAGLGVATFMRKRRAVV